MRLFKFFAFLIVMLILPLILADIARARGCRGGSGRHHLFGGRGGCCGGASRGGNATGGCGGAGYGSGYGYGFGTFGGCGSCGQGFGSSGMSQPIGGGWKCLGCPPNGLGGFGSFSPGFSSGNCSTGCCGTGSCSTSGACQTCLPAKMSSSPTNPGLFKDASAVGYQWYYFPDNKDQAALLYNGVEVGCFDFTCLCYAEYKNGVWGPRGAALPEGVDPPQKPKKGLVKIGECGPACLCGCGDGGKCTCLPRGVATFAQR